MASSDSLKSLAACALTCASAWAQAATVRVPQDEPTIQQAIDVAQPGDEVLVSHHYYFEALVIDKSLTLVSDHPLNPKWTYLDGGGRTNVTIRLADGDRVTVRGFTIVDGHASEGGSAVDARGGTVTLEDDVFQRGHVDGEGAAILQVGGALVMRHDHVLSTGAGGAKSAAVTIRSTHGSYLFDNVIAYNAGSGVHVDGGTRIRIVRDTLLKNTGAALGGGLRIDGNAEVFAGGNLIILNTAQVGGGVAITLGDGAPQSYFASNTIADNQALGGQGHVMSMTGELDVLGFANNIFHTLQTAGVAMYCDGGDHTMPALVSNDVWSPYTHQSSGACRSGIKSGTNIRVDPRFDTTHPGFYHYRLAPYSPLIDVGDNAASARLHLDLTGHPRVIDGGHGDVIDIGAYEFHPE